MNRLVGEKDKDLVVSTDSSIDETSWLFVNGMICPWDNHRDLSCLS